MKRREREREAGESEREKEITAHTVTFRCWGLDILFNDTPLMT